MKNFLNLILFNIVTSCSPSSEQTLSNQDLEDFLATVKSENKNRTYGWSEE